MAQLTLKASLPLGTYYGHRNDGSVENSPSPLRLHAALLAAAGQGPTSEDGQPSDASLKALRWLEKHPPNGLYQPETLLLNRGPHRIGYRDVGTFDATKNSIRKKVEARPISDGVAVRDYYGFMWHDVPEDVAKTLTVLAEDVPYLGESHSVVTISAERFEPNLLLSPTANCFTREAHSRSVPAEGRTDALIAAFNARFKAKPPSLSRDKFSKGQKPASEKPSEASTGETWYEPVEGEPETAPWATAYLFNLDREVDKRDRVALCLSMHKALISRIGFGAAPLITGKYNKGVLPPANRLSIQYIPTELAQLLGENGPLLTLFVPNGASPEELQQVQEAVHIQHLWSSSLGKIGVSFANTTRSGTRFWPAPAAGKHRLWATEMPIVPELRRIRDKDSEWTLADSALVSTGFVWRDRFSIEGKGPKRYISLRDQVAQHNVVVAKTQLVTRSVRKFAHHSPEGVPVQPYDAVLDLGRLHHPQAAIMLGQSRHLGGGLLYPLDIELPVPEQTEES